MKLLNSIRWRPSSRSIATTSYWSRPISISSPTLQEVATPSLETRDPATSKRHVPKRIVKKWTADEHQLLTDELHKGASTREIARLLPGRSMVSIRSKIVVLQGNGVTRSKATKRKHWTAEEKERMLQLRGLGLPFKDIASNFPDRSHKSVEHAMVLARHDLYWSTAPVKNMAWTARADKDLAEAFNRGTSIKEIATSFGRSFHYISHKLRALDLIRRPTYWTPERDMTLLRMRQEGYTLEQISSHVGKSYNSVASRISGALPRDLPVRKNAQTRAEYREFTPSLVEMQEVERLRQQGSSWPAITASTFPDRHVSQVRRFFQLAFNEQPERITKSSKELFSPSEIENIESWLKDKKSWREIAALRYPDLNRHQMRRAYLKHIANLNAKPPIEPFSPSELDGIESLLKNKNPWRKIAALRYPDLTYERIREAHAKHERIRRAYVQQTGRLSKTFAVPSADIPEVKRLRGAGFTWKQIADAKYPDIPWQCSLVRFTEQTELCSEDSGMKSAESNVQQTGQLSKINLAKTPRLQAACNTWQSTRDAIYSGRSYQQVRHASSIWQTRGRSKRGRIGFTLSSADLRKIQRLRPQYTWKQIAEANYPGQTWNQVRYAFVKEFGHDTKRGRIGLNISPSDIVTITCLLEANESWSAIAALMYPSRHPRTVERAFKRQTGYSERTVPFEIPPTVLADFQRLRESKMKWREILALHYPDRKPVTVMAAFRRQMARQHAATAAANNHISLAEQVRRQTVEITNTDFKEIQRLLEAKTSWGEITRLKYPDSKPWSVRKAFLFLMVSSRDGNACAGRLRAIGLSSPDVKGINRLRAAKVSWPDVATLMYPDKSWQTVRTTFLRYMDKHHGGGGVSKSMGRPRAIGISSSDVKEINRLRAVKVSWPDVATLMYTDKNWKAVRTAFLRYMEKHYGGRGVSKSMGRPRSLDLSSAGIEESSIC